MNHVDEAAMQNEMDASMSVLAMLNSPDATVDVAKSHPGVVWDWRYGIKDSKVNAIYRKAVSEQWDVEDLNWSDSIDPSREAFYRENSDFLDPALTEMLSRSQKEAFVSLQLAESLSQILHGEQGALMASCSLAMKLPDKDAKLFAAAQSMDEARHVEVFTRYITRLHDVFPPSATLHRLLEKIMAMKRWEGQLVGTHIVIEGIALSGFSNLRKSTNCSLLQNLLKYVMRDEARHVAFGNNCLKQSMADMHPDDRAEIEDFAAGLVEDVRQWGTQPEDHANFIRNLIRIGIDPLDYTKKLKQNLEFCERTNLSSGMSKGLSAVIMPGLQRVGLITDRTRERFAESELSDVTNLRALQELEESLIS